MTNYQSTSRNQRPKGLKVKQALQFTLLLAICIWLLYQIKPSRNEKKNHVENSQNKLSEESRTVILGRKGNAAWSTDRSDSESEGANFVGEIEKKDDGDTENEKKDDVKVEYFQEKTDIAAHDETEMHDNNLVLDKYEAVKENHEDEVSTEKGSTTAVHHKGVVNVTMEMEDGAHSFHDENGIPQDLESDYQKRNLHRSNISTSKNQSRMVEREAVVGEDVESKKDRIVTIQDSKNDIKAVADSETIKKVQESKV